MSRKITDAELALYLPEHIGKDASPRGRLFAVAEILRIFTDENEGMTALEIARTFGRISGKTPSEKTVSDDIHAIAEICPFGMKIVLPSRGENVGYRCVGSVLSSDEALLLADMVKTSKFITGDQHNKLSEGLSGLIPVSRRDEMLGSVFVDEREAYEASNALSALKTASKAIERNEKIAFRYKTHMMNGTESKSSLYFEDPVAIVLSFGHYYLETCVSTEEYPEGGPWFRRLDHMRDAMAIGQPIENMKRVFELRKTVVRTTNELFDMRGDGVSRTLFLKVEGRFAQYVYDRFGHDIKFEHIDDKLAIGYVRAKVQLSETFFRWLFGMGNGIKIARPVNNTWLEPFWESSPNAKKGIDNLMTDYDNAINGFGQQIESSLKMYQHSWHIGE